MPLRLGRGAVRGHATFSGSDSHILRITFAFLSLKIRTAHSNCFHKFSGIVFPGGADIPKSRKFPFHRGKLSTDNRT